MLTRLQFQCWSCLITTLFFFTHFFMFTWMFYAASVKPNHCFLSLNKKYIHTHTHLPLAWQMNNVSQETSINIPRWHSVCSPLPPPTPHPNQSAMTVAWPWRCQAQRIALLSYSVWRLCKDSTHACTMAQRWLKLLLHHGGLWRKSL